MKCVIPEISWHNRDPVLSVDIQPKLSTAATNECEFYRVASGGTDSHVLVSVNRLFCPKSINGKISTSLSRFGI